MIDAGKKYTFLCKNGCDTLLDSSTNLITISKDDLKIVNGKINARPFALGRFEVIAKY